MLPPQPDDTNLTGLTPHSGHENGHGANGAGAPGALIPMGAMLNQLPASWPGAAPARPEILTAGPDPMSLLHALRRRWLPAFGVGMLCAVVLAGATWLLVPANYDVAALFRVRRDPVSVSGQDRERVDPRIFDIIKDTQVALIKSDLVMRAALRRPGVAQLPMVRQESDQVRWLQEEVGADFPGGGEILRISMKGENPNEIQKIVEAVQQAYRSEVLDKDRDELLAQRDDLDKALKKKRGEIRAVRNRYVDLAEQNGTGADQDSVRNKISIGLNQLGSLSRERTDLMRSRTHAAQGVAELQAAMSKAESPQAFESLIEQEMRKDPQVQELMMQVVSLDQAIRGTELTSPDPANDRRLVRLREQKRSIDEAMFDKKAELRPLVESALFSKELIQIDLDSAEQQLKLLDDQIADVDQQIADNNAKVESLGGVDAEMEAMRLELENMELVASDLSQKLDMLDIDLQGTQNRISLIQSATPSDFYDWILKTVLVAFAAMSGFVVGSLGIVVNEFRGRRINSASQVSLGLGMRVVGALPSLNGGANGAMQGLLAESIDSVRTTLLHAASAQATKIVMVTSAVDQEGKTTVASQLAASIARCGRRTLLVDGDIRRPSIHELLDMPLGPGFSEVLRGETNLDEAISPTRVAGLWLLPAGNCDLESVQAMAKDGVETIFESLRPEFDFVIVDSAPVLTVNDALALGQHVDTAIISVLRDISSAPNVYEAGERLKSVGVEVLGAVVNGESRGTHRRMYELTAAS